MKKRSVLFPVILILSLTLIKCIDPFYPKLEKFQSLLVVDALLTDEDVPAYVRLTRTTETLEEQTANGYRCHCFNNRRSRKQYITD